MKVVNFAHGQLLMVGAYVTFSFFVLSGFNPYVLLRSVHPNPDPRRGDHRTALFPPILGTGKLNEIFISIGLIYILENVAALVWGDEWRVIHSPYEAITIAVGG